MSGYDAAAIVGRLAGLGAQDAAAPARVPPARLIERFCSAETAAGPVADRGTRRRDGVTVSRGHCGYVGGRGDSMVVGFDDGYDWMGYLAERGWRELPAKGDWPYVVYLAWRRRSPDDPFVIAEYCEGDLTLWEFATQARAEAHYAGLRDCP